MCRPKGRFSFLNVSRSTRRTLVGHISRFNGEKKKYKSHEKLHKKLKVKDDLRQLWICLRFEQLLCIVEVFVRVQRPRNFPSEG